MREGGETEAIRGRLLAGLDQMGIDLTSAQVERMIGYLLLLLRWNRIHNLTAVREPLEMVSKHLLDSLSVLPHLYGNDLLDVGTGPGLPGIPLALASPQRSCSLLESRGKKARFVQQVVMELALENVSVIQARMESYLPGRKFATIVSRAVASVPALVTATGQLLARPARLLVMKGLPPAMAELTDLDPPPDQVRIHPLEVPFLNAARHLIDVRYE